jgi:hypothetical protein
VDHRTTWRAELDVLLRSIRQEHAAHLHAVAGRRDRTGQDGYVQPVGRRTGAGRQPGSCLAGVALLFMLACWLVGYWLDKRKIYIKV